MTPAANRGAELLELAEGALAEAGGDAQVTVTSERSLSSRFACSQPTQATAVQDIVVQFLCLVDGHVATAETNALDADALRASARCARVGAEAAARQRGQSGEYPGLPLPAAWRAHDGFDPDTAQLDPQRAGTALEHAFAVASRRGLQAFGLWTAGDTRVAIASSTGLRAHDAVTDAHMRVICRDEHGRSGYAAETSVACSTLDGARLAERAAAKVDAREPVRVGPGDYPVVLAREAVGTLLGFLGNLAFNGLAHAEGRGALNGRLGQRVAAPCISLSDSPRYAGTLPRGFDAEGVPKSPLPLIQDGVAHRVVHDSRSAARAGGQARSTGHALAPGGSPEGPAPTNMVLIGGGAADEQELARPIERGLYVTRLWYANAVDDRRTLLTGTTRDGTFLIEDGCIGPPVGDLRFTDAVLRILSATEALTATPRLVSEAELYGRRFAHGSVCPALRASEFRITAAAG